MVTRPQPISAGPFTRAAACSAVRAMLGATALWMSAQAAAADYAPREVGEWTVAASKDGKGCFLTKAYDRSGATTLLFGLDRGGTNRLTVLNANWSIKPKDRLELTYRLSKGSFPKHFAVGIASGGQQGFVTSFGEEFPAYFAASKELQIFRGDVPVERLSLEGSGAAVAELRRCVDARSAGSAPATRDTGSADSIPADPFAAVPDRKRRK